MHFVQTAIGLLLLSVPVGACTIFDARSDCTNNPWGCAGETTTTTEPQSCDSAADCSPRACYLTLCEGGACVEIAQTDVVCAEWNGLCNNGTCELLIGSPCQSGDVCQSGFCADGVCCDAECNGLCVGCAAALTDGVDGVCTSLEVGKNGLKDEECGGKGGCGAQPGHCRCADGQMNGGETEVDCGGGCVGTCKGSQTCNDNEQCASEQCEGTICCGVQCTGECMTCSSLQNPGACTPLDAGTSCGMNMECDGLGQCLAQNGAGCAVNGDCQSGFCATMNGSMVCEACSADSNCSESETCVSWKSKEVCRILRDKGDSCQEDKWCKDGLQCVDEVCCDTSCTGKCRSCRVEYTGVTSGTCAPISKGLDPHNECSGPGAGATCSGANAVNGASACGENSP